MLRWPSCGSAAFSRHHKKGEGWRRLWSRSSFTFTSQPPLSIMSPTANTPAKRATPMPQNQGSKPSARSTSSSTATELTWKDQESKDNSRMLNGGTGALDAGKAKISKATWEGQKSAGNSTLWNGLPSDKAALEYLNFKPEEKAKNDGPAGGQGT